MTNCVPVLTNLGHAQDEMFEKKIRNHSQRLFPVIEIMCGCLCIKFKLR